MPGFLKKPQPPIFKENSDVLLKNAAFIASKVELYNFYCVNQRKFLLSFHFNKGLKNPLQPPP
jgi:hypothetical protein